MAASLRPTGAAGAIELVMSCRPLSCCRRLIDTIDLAGQTCEIHVPDIGSNPISVAALRQAAPLKGSFDAEYGNSVTLAPAAR